MQILDDVAELINGQWEAMTCVLVCVHLYKEKCWAVCECDCDSECECESESDCDYDYNYNCECDCDCECS